VHRGQDDREAAGYQEGARQAARPPGGRDWFTVLSGAIVLRLGERTILVRAGEAAEFSTMEPHAFGVQEGAAEILCILDHDGTRTCQ